MKYYENVHMITDLPTRRRPIKALSQWQRFLRVFTYKMAANIKWHRYGTKLRHCHSVYWRTMRPSPLCLQQIGANCE